MLRVRLRVRLRLRARARLRLRLRLREESMIDAPMLVPPMRQLVVPMLEGGGCG